MPRSPKKTTVTKTSARPKAKTTRKAPVKPKAKTATKAPVRKVVAKAKVTTKSRIQKPLRKTGVKTKGVQSELVKKYRAKASDTGSVAVQIALLSNRIQFLAKHLKKHIHDADSKRGLLILVGKRRRLLNYMRTKDEKKYTKLISDLKLKK